MTVPTSLSGQAWRLPLTTPPFPNETARSYVARLALLNRIPYDRVFRRFYSAESALDQLNLLAARSGHPPSTLWRAIPELAATDSGPDDAFAEVARLWACQLCVAAQTGRNDWKVEIWGVRDLSHLCIKHRHWTGGSSSLLSFSFAREVAGPARGQFSLVRAPEIVHAQRVFFEICRQRRYQRIFPVYAECVEFWRDVAKHGYAADRTEDRIDLIASNETDVSRRYRYRDAALFPDIIEAVKLFASRFWLRQALGSPSKAECFRKEFERRLPAERNLRTTAISWFARELTLVAQRIAERLDQEERELMRIADSDQNNVLPYFIRRQILRRTPSHAR